MASNAQAKSPEGIGEELVERVLDALNLAKRTLALLPPLPPGVRPVHIRILRAMQRLDFATGARVSDINDALRAALPNTTRFINELVALEVVQKVSDSSDGRVVLIRTTALGERYADEYVRKLHRQMARAFSRIGRAECGAMIETLSRVHSALASIRDGIGTESRGVRAVKRSRQSIQSRRNKRKTSS